MAGATGGAELVAGAGGGWAPLLWAFVAGMLLQLAIQRGVAAKVVVSVVAWVKHRLSPSEGEVGEGVAFPSENSLRRLETSAALTEHSHRDSSVGNPALMQQLVMPRNGLPSGRECVVGKEEGREGEGVFEGDEESRAAVLKRLEADIEMVIHSCISHHGIQGVRLTGWLGRGSFSNVYRAMWGTTQTALKICKVEMKEKYIRMIKMEAAISCSTCHPNLVITYRYSIHRGSKSSKSKAKTKVSTHGSSAVNKSEYVLPSRNEEGAGPHSRHMQLLEVRLLQECCNLGTLRSAIKQKKLAKGHNVFSPLEDKGLGGDTPFVASDSYSRGVPDQTDTVEGQFSQSSMCGLEGMVTVNTYRKLLVDTPGDESLGRVSIDSSSGMGLSDNMQDMSLVLSIASDVCEGMLYLHSRGIIHADLKASNVLLKTVVSDGVERVVAKVSDFGTSVILAEGQKEVHGFFAGTPTHMSPETIEFSVISKASDVYAFGIFLYEIASGAKAYPGSSAKEIMRDVVEMKLRPRMRVWIYRPLLLLMSDCWQHEPTRRPTFAAIQSRLAEICKELVPAEHLGCLQPVQSRVPPKRSRSLSVMQAYHPEPVAAVRSRTDSVGRSNSVGYGGLAKMMQKGAMQGPPGCPDNLATVEKAESPDGSRGRVSQLKKRVTYSDSPSPATLLLDKQTEVEGRTKSMDNGSAHAMAAAQRALIAEQKTAFVSLEANGNQVGGEDTSLRGRKPRESLQSVEEVPSQGSSGKLWDMHGNAFHRSDSVLVGPSVRRGSIGSLPISETDGSVVSPNASGLHAWSAQWGRSRKLTWESLQQRMQQRLSVGGGTSSSRKASDTSDSGAASLATRGHLAEEAFATRRKLLQRRGSNGSVPSRKPSTSSDAAEGLSPRSARRVTTTRVTELTASVGVNQPPVESDSPRSGKMFTSLLAAVKKQLPGRHSLNNVSVTRKVKKRGGYFRRQGSAGRGNERDGMHAPDRSAQSMSALHAPRPSADTVDDLDSAGSPNPSLPGDDPPPSAAAVAPPGEPTKRRSDSEVVATPDVEQTPRIAEERAEEVGLPGPTQLPESDTRTALSTHVASAPPSLPSRLSGEGGSMGATASSENRSVGMAIGGENRQEAPATRRLSSSAAVASSSSPSSSSLPSARTAAQVPVVSKKVTGRQAVALREIRKALETMSDPEMSPAERRASAPGVSSCAVGSLATSPANTRRHSVTGSVNRVDPRKSTGKSLPQLSEYLSLSEIYAEPGKSAGSVVSGGKTSVGERQSACSSSGAGNSWMGTQGGSIRSQEDDLEEEGTVVLGLSDIQALSKKYEGDEIGAMLDAEVDDG